MKLNNMKIGFKLALGFGLIIILTGLIGIFANININSMWRITEDMYRHPLTVSKVVRDIKTNIIAMHRSMKDISMAKNDIQIDQAEVKVSEYERQVFSSFEIIFDRFLGDPNDVTIAQNAFVNWKPIRDEVIRLRREGKVDEAAAITMGKGADYVASLNLKIQTMIDFANLKGDEFYSEAQLVKSSTVKNSLILLSIITLIGILLAVIITYSITKPLLSMLAVSNRLAEGDLSARNTDIATNETGILANSINELASSVESRNTIQKGVSDISDTMIGKSSIIDFGSGLLKQLMKITGAYMSTFYVLNKETSVYEHFASVGANEALMRPFNAANPEGEFSNVITTKSIFYHKDIPENTIFKYITTSGEAIPREIISIPIIVEDNVVALISLVNIQKFKEEYYRIIEQSWTAINTFYSNLMASEKTRLFAEELSISNMKLEAQTEELQEQSEELQEQANRLHETSEELQEQNIELEAQSKQVESATKLKSEFLSNMSHELRTPLNSIMALSRVLITRANKKLNTEENKFLKIIERNGKRLLTLINDILDISKIESGKIDIVPEIILLKPLLQTIIDSLSALTNEKGLQLTLNIPDDLPQIESDGSRLNQILTNIISNAVKFTKTGSVDISVMPDKDNVSIEVVDTGIGITKNILPHIFDEFRQADGTSSRQFEGTGLGLAIANKLTKILGGNIKVKSELGKGSIFTISLPFKYHEDIPLVQKTGLKDSTLRAWKKTILVVDDDQKIVDSISKNLEEAGYNTLSANSGKQTLEMAEKHQPFAITLDIIMPEMDGWEVLEELKSNPKTKNIPVIIVSITDDKVTGLALGAVGYITKPVDMDILISEIKQLNKTAEIVMIVDDNEFDRTQMAEIIEAEEIKTILVKGGKECIELLKNSTPDILVLDLMMPDMDGFKVLGEIRKDTATRNLPVIIVTAKDLTTEEKEILKGNVSKVIAKSEASTLELQKEIMRIIKELEKTQRVDNTVKEESETRILIVEDNPDAIVQIKSVLENEHYKVDVANGGEDALNYILRTLPDGIILDLMMPDIDGFEVLEKIRSTERTKRIPILILTAKDLTRADLDKLSANNIQQLIHKGDVDIDGLLFKVKLMLRNVPKETKVKPEHPKQKEKVEHMEGTQRVEFDKKTSKLRIKTSYLVSKILIIEDNPDNMVTMKAILQGNYIISEAADGELGLELAQSQLPDLILLDMALPKMSGEEIIKILKNDDDTKHIPVIAVTAQAMKGDKEKFIRAGCDGYISKPVDVGVLLAEIDNLLNK